MIKKFLITGNPGVGKTTLVLYIVNKVKGLGYKVSGFYCPEVRENNVRVGFKIHDLVTGKEGWLAKVNVSSDKRVGKYGIIKEASEIALLSKNSMSDSDLVVIDEIGPMELSVSEIKDVIYYALNLDKPLVAVVHRNIRLNVSNAKLYRVTIENRDRLREVILNEILSVLK
ncbi:MAG: NTPase [Sulfolobaceae archaeon]|nr:NTPase [Sulfolobaceae archaeon]